MMGIKTSHEVPLSMLEQSRAFNDYDYALVHLFEKYPKYYDFFKKSIEMGRDVLLDNSIFELKEAFEPAEFAYWIKKLEPTRYIIPDVLDDAVATIENIDSWNKLYKPNLKGRTIGVVQGKDYDELTACYKVIAETCDEIAICFPHSWHQSEGLEKNAFEMRMKNRKLTLDIWIQEGIIQEDKRHHLLGCLLPQEFKAYKKGYDWIYSLDTSNPIIHGMEGILYEDGCLDDKVDKKMADNMEVELSPIQIANIYYNIYEFKSNLI